MGGLRQVIISAIWTFSWCMWEKNDMSWNPCFDKLDNPFRQYEKLSLIILCCKLHRTDHSNFVIFNGYYFTMSIISIFWVSNGCHYRKVKLWPSHDVSFFLWVSIFEESHYFMLRVQVEKHLSSNSVLFTLLDMYITYTGHKHL